jgi:hypothetical protein
VENRPGTGGKPGLEEDPGAQDQDGGEQPGDNSGDRAIAPAVASVGYFW